jgi:hypothetical protein
MRLLYLAVPLLAGCALQPGGCPARQQAATMDLLYFGTGRPHGPDVTPQEWSAFVGAEIAPRFPQGFSVLEAQGQWRNADGSVAHELTHVLQVLHPDDAATAAALDAIAARYKAQFQQEAVLQVHAPACMAFR